MAFESIPRGYGGRKLDSTAIASLRAPHDGMMLVIIDHHPVVIPIFPSEMITDESIAEIKANAAAVGHVKFAQIMSCTIADAVQRVGQARSAKKAKAHHERAAGYAFMYRTVTGHQFALIEHNSRTQETWVG